MKILMVTTFFPPAKGGIQTYSFQIAHHLQRKGHTVTVCALATDGIKKFGVGPSLKIHQNGIKAPLRKILQRHDVVMATSWFPAGIIGFGISCLHRIPLFISAHGNEILYPDRVPLMNKLMQWVFGGAKEIFAVSTYTKQLLANRGVPSENIFVIPNGTNPDFFHPDVETASVYKKLHLKNQETKIIFSVSRIEKKKNFGAVIRILPSIVEKIPNLVYVVGGRGPMEQEWRSLACKLGIENKTIFTGYIPSDELPKYYAASDVFIMPSLELQESGEVEGFGIAFLEANACETPVIGTSTGGIDEAIIHEQTGLIVNPEDNKELQAAIMRILNDEHFADKLGRQGRKRVMDELNWSFIAEKIKGRLMNG